jgi:hypothetical protein
MIAAEIVQTQLGDAEIYFDTEVCEQFTIVPNGISDRLETAVSNLQNGLAH